ncbi:MAG TPA: SDR family oxidoreductase [Actinomycetota bacterium]|jgi:NAD(P)-dependent dehydrogenase (short-subunit alcohol dehydrogenase family)
MTVTNSLRGKVVVVTGASAGVGRAAAEAFGAEGATVALLARGDEGLEAAAKDVERAGGTGLAIPTDVADPAQVEAAAERAERELGPIEVWVNDAMTSVFAPLWEIDPEEFRRVTDVTYHGVVFGSMAAVRRMRPRGRGAIVQIGSALAYRGIPLQSAYCGAKHAIQGFNDSLRAELFHDRSGVHVTMVQMPALNTPQFDWVKTALPHRAQPVPPIYQPEVAGRAIVFAARHPGRREYWVGATTAATIVANTVIPGVLDRYLGRTGFSSQQTDQPEDPARPFNLWEPVDRATDHGPHGRFDDRAHSRSAQWWWTTHRALVAAGAAVAGGIGIGLAGRRRR